MRNIKVITGILAVVFFLGLTGVAIASDTDEFTNYGMSSTSEMENHETSKDVERTSPTNEVERINPLFCTLDLVNQNKVKMVNDCTQEDLEINRG